MDALAATVWYAVTVMVIWLAWTVARRVFPGDGSTQCTMHTVTLMWTWIVLVSCGLGTFGVLNATSLAVGVLVIAFGSWLWVRARFARRSLATDAEATNERWTARCWHMVWIAIGATAVVLVVRRGLTQFPDDWDTLMYHRPLIVLWLQTGSLYVPTCAVWHVPGNNELLGLWWAAAFSGDFWVALMNIPAALLLALGTYEVTRLIGLPLVLRHATAIAVLGGSIVFQQIASAKNDVAVAGLFVTGLAYGIRYVRSRDFCDLALGGAALGLLAGVKYYALGYAGVAWLGLTTIAWCQRGRRAAVTMAVMLGAIMLLPAGYWYGRNLVATGTPFYPLGYSGDNASELKLGPRRSAWRSSLLGNGRPELWPQYLQAVWKEDGICQTAAVLVLPLSLTWLLARSVAFLKWKRRLGLSAPRFGLAVVLVGAWLNFAITPFTVVSNEQHIGSSFLVVRFSQVPLTLSVIAFSLLLSDVSRWIKEHVGDTLIRSALSSLLPASFTAAAFASFWATADGMMHAEWPMVGLIAFNLALVSMILGELSAPTDRLLAGLRRVALPAVLISGMGGFVFSSVCLSQWWHANFASHYDQRFQTRAYSNLEAWKPPLPTIASLHFRYYPLFGSRRQFHVHRPLRVMSVDFLLTYLVAQRIEIIAVAHRGNETELDTSRRLREWMNEHPGVFEKINSGGFFHVYRIDQGRLRGYVNKRGLDTPDSSVRTAKRSSFMLAAGTAVSRRARMRETKFTSYRRYIAQIESPLATKTENQV